MNRIILSGNTSMELVQAIAYCLSQCEEKSIIILKNASELKAPAELEPFKLPDPIDVKRIEKQTGTAKENYSHRSKFHAKKL